MGGYGRLETLVICLGQILPSKFHNNFNLRNKITKKICHPLDFYVLTHERFASPYTSQNAVPNPLIDWV